MDTACLGKQALEVPGRPAACFQRDAASRRLPAASRTPRSSAAHRRALSCPSPVPQDAYNSGFALLRSQGACRAAYLQAALAEYVASLCSHASGVAPSLAALYVDLLLDQVARAGPCSRLLIVPPTALHAALGKRATRRTSRGPIRWAERRRSGALLGLGPSCGACRTISRACQAVRGRRSLLASVLTPGPWPLTLQGLPHLVAPLLLSHPQLGSVLLAEHVEEAEGEGRLPGGVRLAEQLLQRLGAAEARCRLLLRAGCVRQALVLARRERLVGQLAPAALIEAAACQGDVLLEAAARRVVGAAGAGRAPAAA